MKRQYRFFGGLLNAQEKWLNKMAGNGYRLVRVGKLLYEFEECEPNPFAALHVSKNLPEVERLRLMVAKLEIENERLKKDTW